MEKKKPKSKKTVKAGAKRSTKKIGVKRKTKIKTTKEIKKVKKQAKPEKEIKKPAKKTLKKPAAKKPGSGIKEKAKKVTTEKKVSKAIRTEKASKKEPRKIALPKKKVAGVPGRTLKAVEEKFEPLKSQRQEKAYQPGMAKKGLPTGYGEDRITLMTVDPWKLFAYWEVKEDTLYKIKGTLVLRVYDVTGIYFDGKNANIVFDIPIYDRIGDSYIGVGPGREFIVDIGAVSFAGIFVTSARSNKVGTPTVKVTEKEGVLTKETPGTIPLVGYF